MDIIDRLDQMAERLEKDGYVKEAYEIDLVANTLEAAAPVQQARMDFRPSLKVLKTVAQVYPPIKGQKGDLTQDVDLQNGAFVQISMNPEGHADLNGAPFKMTVVDRETRQPMKMTAGKVFKMGSEGAIDDNEVVQKVRLLSRVPAEAIEAARSFGQKEQLQQRSRARLQPAQ